MELETHSKSAHSPFSSHRSIRNLAFLYISNNMRVMYIIWTAGNFMRIRLFYFWSRFLNNILLVISTWVFQPINNKQLVSTLAALKQNKNLDANSICHLAKWQVWIQIAILPAYKTSKSFRCRSVNLSLIQAPECDDNVSGPAVFRWRRWVR